MLTQLGLKKKVSYKGHSFVIKQLSPVDFLSDGKGVINYLFQKAKVKTQFEKVKELAGMKDVDTSDLAERFELMKRLMNLSVIKYSRMKPFNVDKFFLRPLNMEVGLWLFGEIIRHSHKVFSGIQNIDFDEMIIIDAMAKRYGKLPIDVVARDYTEMDSFLFNLFAISVGSENEMREAKKQLAKIKGK